MRYLQPVIVAATLVAGSVLAVSLTAQTGGAPAEAAPAGWKVPRTPDGRPDLQGVWGNNSVTPMTRPTQWKDKTSLTDAELEDLKKMATQFVDQGGDAIFGNFVQLMLNAKDQGAFKQVLGTTRRPATTTSSGWPTASGTTGRRSLPIPPDGLLPALTPEAVARRAEAARVRAARGRGPSDGPEDRPLSERASRTAPRARRRTTTATSRSSSRPQPWSCCRR